MSDPQAESAAFERRLRVEVHHRFRFLVDDYGYSMGDPTDELGGITVRYLNRTVNMGVSVDIERRDLHVMVLVGTLEAGMFRTGLSTMNQVFTVDLMLAVRIPGSSTSSPNSWPVREDPMRRIGWLAQSLQQYGDDVLRGSTAVFPALANERDKRWDALQRAEAKHEQERRAKERLALGVLGEQEQQELDSVSRHISQRPRARAQTWEDLLRTWRRTARLTEIGYPFWANSFNARARQRAALQPVIDNLVPGLRQKLEKLLMPIDAQYFQWTFQATTADTRHAARSSDVPWGPWWGRMPRRVTAKVAQSYRDLGLDVEVVPDHNETYSTD